MKRERSKCISIYLSLTLGLCVAVYAMLCFSGAERNYRLWYYVPAAMLVGAFIGERFQQAVWQRKSFVLCLDIGLSCVCLARPLIHWPPASGHAAFGIYALLTCSNAYTRGLAILVLLITFYAKLWLWHGDMTLWTGLLLGGVAGVMCQKTTRQDFHQE